MIVAPVIQCTTQSSTPAEATSAPLPITSDTLPACVDIARPSTDADCMGTAAVQLDVSYGDGRFVPLLTTPVVTAQGNNQIDLQRIEHQGMVLAGHFNPRSGPGRAQVCATLHVPQCGY